MGERSEYKYVSKSYTTSNTRKFRLYTSWNHSNTNNFKCSQKIDKWYLKN